MRLYLFRLRQNIILHRFRCFPAVMALVLLFKSTPALRTCPHLPYLLYPLSLTVTLTLSPGCFPIRYLFPHTYNIADTSVRIFYSHIYNTAVIFFSVKCGVYFYPSPSEFFPDIIGKNDISAACFTCSIKQRFIFIHCTVHYFTSSNLFSPV